MNRINIVDAVPEKQQISSVIQCDHRGLSELEISELFLDFSHPVGHAGGIPDARFLKERHRIIVQFDETEVDPRRSPFAASLNNSQFTVTDQEMLFEVLHGGDLGTCMDRLLAISKANGASDNVTAVLMRMA